MHHGPANKLHRVATPLPLSLSCQVEPLKHSLSTPLHFHPSIHPSISSSGLPHSWRSLLHAPPPRHLLPLYTHQACRSDFPPFRHSPSFLCPTHLSLLLALHPPTQTHPRYVARKHLNTYYTAIIYFLLFAQVILKYRSHLISQEMLSTVTAGALSDYQDYKAENRSDTLEKANSTLSQ